MAETLAPGFPVSVGFENFTKIFTDPAIRGPFMIIFVWTFIWAFMSVLETFVLGLLLALNMNSPNIPMQRLLRVLLIIPYAIPPFITVKVWVGLLNPVLGILGTKWDPGWFTDPFWAKIGILIVNLWLGFPYMFLIITGALQSIPSDIYEAARVDGAGPLYQFRRLTLPLLLVSIGPLLIGSFAFNFNNFAIIDLYNAGRSPHSRCRHASGVYRHPDQLHVSHGVWRCARQRLRPGGGDFDHHLHHRGPGHDLQFPLHRPAGGDFRKCLAHL